MLMVKLIQQVILQVILLRELSDLPRFQRNDLHSNLYIYRSEVISDYIKDVQDGIYHLLMLKADNAITTEFTDQKYSQNVTDLYPQQDKDNENDNPPLQYHLQKEIQSVML